SRLFPPPTSPFVPYPTLFRSVIATRGLVHFWPASLQEYQYTDSSGAQMAILGERVQREQVTAEQIRNSGVAVPEGEEVLDRQLRSEEHTSELQSRFDLVCRLL